MRSQSALAYRRRRSCRDKALGLSTKVHNTISPYFFASNTMLPTPLSDSPYLTWIGASLLLAAGLYYYSTKTDIPKIKGIPEIPGALPMFFLPCAPLLMLDLAIFLTLAMYILSKAIVSHSRIMQQCVKSGLRSTDGQSFRSDSVTCVPWSSTPSTPVEKC